MNFPVSGTTSPSCSRQRLQSTQPQRYSRRHCPRPVSLLEAIDGLNQALTVLKASLGTTQVSQSSRHAWPQRQSQPPAIAMPWLDECQSPQSPQASEAQEPDWDSDLWSCPWDDLSVQELRSLLREYPIDRRSLPAPIELLRRSELIEALSQLQEISD
jgi:hypothetical protein